MKKILGFLLLFVTQTLFAHGEDQTGPHGGVIRMPGAFHTEVMQDKSGLKIMLLDINFQNPTTKDSSIKAMIKTEGAVTELKCKQKANAFVCEASQEMMAKGALEIIPVRQKAEGAAVKYDLPLKSENA